MLLTINGKDSFFLYKYDFEFSSSGEIVGSFLMTNETLNPRQIISIDGGGDGVNNNEKIQGFASPSDSFYILSDKGVSLLNYS